MFIIFFLFFFHFPFLGGEMARILRAHANNDIPDRLTTTATTATTATTIGTARE